MRKYTIPPEAIDAVRYIESAGKRNAVSSKGARGSMQVMPATARAPGYGVRPARDNSIAEFDRVGVDLLQALFNKYLGDLDLTAAAYNAGAGAVDRHGGVPPYKETQHYIEKLHKRLGEEGVEEGEEGTVEPQAKESPVGTPFTDAEIKMYEAKRAERKQEEQPQPQTSAEPQAKESPVGTPFTAEEIKMYGDRRAERKQEEQPQATTKPPATTEAQPAPNPPVLQSTQPVEAQPQATKELTPEQQASLGYKAKYGPGKLIQGVGETILGFGDTGKAVGQGILDLPKAAVGLSDLVTGGATGKYLAEHGLNINAMQTKIDEGYSPEYRAEQKVWQDADGVAEHLKALVLAPNAVGGEVLKTLPTLMGIGHVASGLKGLGIGTSTALGAAEGGLTAAQTAEDYRNADPEGKLHLKQGLTAVGAGVTTAIIGKYGNIISGKMGGIDPDTLFMGGFKRAIEKPVQADIGAIRRVLTSMVGEGVIEEAPQSAIEKMWNNIGTDNPKGIFDGVPNDAIKGGMLGSIVGGGAAVVAPSQDQTTPTRKGEEALTKQKEIEQENKDLDKSGVIESWGINKTTKKGTESKLHKSILDEDFNTAEGLDNIETAYNESDHVGINAKTNAQFEKDLEELRSKLLEQEQKQEEQKQEEAKVPPSAEAERYKENDWFHPVHNPEGAILPPASEAKDQGQKQAAPVPLHTPETLIEGFKTSRPINFSTNTQVKKALTEQGVPEEQNTLELQQQIRAAHNAHVQGIKEKPAAVVGEQEQEKEEPYVDAVKVEMYDKALDKVEEVVLGDKKSSAKPLILKLIDQGLLTKEHLVNYENIFKDKDMGLDDIMSEVRTDLEIGRETALTSATARPTKLLNLEQGKVEAPIDEEVADEDLTQYERDQARVNKLAAAKVEQKATAELLEKEKLAKLALERQAIKDKEFHDLSHKEMVDINNTLSGKFDLYDYLNQTDAKSTGIQHVNASNAKTSLLDHAAKTKTVAALINKLTKGKDFFALDEKTKDKVRHLQSFELAATKEVNRMDRAYGRHDWYKTLKAEINKAATKKPLGKPKKTITPEEVEYGNEIAKQGEQGYFSVASTDVTTGHTAASLERNLFPEMKRLVASGKAVIHDTVEDLNKAVPGTHPANVQGLTTKEGVTHYVANKLTPETLHKVALHETGVHAGMRKMLGDKLWAYVKNQAMTNQSPAFVKARASVPEGTPDHLIAEETLAYLVENSPNLSLVRQIVAAIRNFLRAKLGANIKLSEADARQMAVASMRRESKTKELTPREATAYSLPPQSAEAAKHTAETDAKRIVTPKFSLLNYIKGTSERGTGIVPRTLDLIETNLARENARFVNQIRRNMRAMNVPMKDIEKVIVEVEASQSAHEMFLSEQASHIGHIEYVDDISKFSIVPSQYTIDSMKQALVGIAATHKSSEGEVRERFNQLMLARRMLELHNIISAHEATLAAMPDTTKADKRARAQFKVNTLNPVKKQTSGTTEVQAKAIINDARTTMPEFFDTNGPIDIWNHIRKQAVELLVSSGRATKSQANNYMSFAAFVPLNRVMESSDPDAAFESMFRGGHGVTTGMALHKFKGSERLVNDVIDNIHSFMVNTSVMAMRTQKARMMVDAARAFLPVGDVQEVKDSSSGTNVIPIYRAGKKEFYNLKDPLFIPAFKGGETIKYAIIEKFAAPIAKFLRSTIVLDPLFTLSQIHEDTIDAMVTSNLRNPVMLIPSVTKEFLATFIKEGFFTPKFISKYIPETKARSALKAIGAAGEEFIVQAGDKEANYWRAPISTTKSGWFKRLLFNLAHFSSIGDNAIRQAVYSRTMKETGNKRLASERAFEIINFRRKGASSAITIARQSVAFFGAYLQVTNIALRTLSGTGIAPIEKKKALATLVSTGAQLATFSLIYNMLLGAGDDDDDTSNKDRDTKLYIFGGTNSDYALPIRPSINTLPIVFTRYIYNSLIKEASDTPRDTKIAIQRAAIGSLGKANPLNINSVRPIYDVLNNVSAFTGRAILGPELAGLEPQMQYNPDTTSKLGVLSGEYLGVSGIKFDYLVKGYAGFVGAAFLSLTNRAIEEGSGGNKHAERSFKESLREVPGAGKFLSEKKQGKLREILTNWKEGVEGVYGTYKRMVTVDKAHAEDYRLGHLPMMHAHGAITAIEKALGEVRTEVNRTHADPELSPQQKTTRLKELDEIEKNIFSEVKRLNKETFYPE